MKKINLISRLLSYSHEKQSPQRFARYAAMLIMLLTFGVGQMWATKRVWIDVTNAPSGYTGNMQVQYTVNKSSWTHVWAQDYGTIGGRSIYYADIADNAVYWQVHRGDNLNGNYYNFQYEQTYATNNKYTVTGWDNSGSGSKVIGMVKGGYMLFDNSKTNWSYGYRYFVIGHDSYYATTGGNESSRVVTNTKLWCIDNNSAAWPDAKYYAFLNHNGSYPSASKAWSDIDTWGKEKTSQYTDAYSLDKDQIYLCIPASGSGKPTFTINWQDGYSDLNKTVTLKAKVSTNGGSTYSETNSPGALSASSYKFSTWNTCGTQDATTTGSVSAGSASGTFTAGYTANTSVSAADVTGYDFVGWYEGSTLVLDGSRTGTMNPHGAVTLYAYYKVKQYTVSYGVNSSTRYGSITLNSGSSVSTTSSSTLNHGTSISFTASPSSGYQVEGWYGDAACSSNKKLQSGGTSYNAGTLTAATTVYVKFEVRTGGTVTLTAGTGGQVSLDNSNWGASKAKSEITTATAFNIYAQASTGYTFSAWAKSSGSGSITSTSSASTSFTPVAYEDATVTASFNETMSTLTTSCAYDAGTPGYSVPSKSVSSIGIATTADVTATAPGTGYTFAGWTLTHCVRTDSNGETSRSITIRSDGSGSAATAQANYEEDLSSPWTLKGGTNLTGNNWATTYNLTKKSGHSTESVAYYTFSISSTNNGVSGSADDWSFKLINSSWYGVSASGSYWWQRSTSANLTLSTSGQNIQICADVAGNYEVKVDYTTPASPKVTVTFPTSYTLTYSIGSVAGTSGSISTSPSTASGSKVLEGSSITLTGPAAKTGYTWKGWYTNAAGTEGKITDTNRAISVTMDADKTLYACYEETLHTEPVNVAEYSTGVYGGTVSPTSVQAGIATAPEVTATIANKAWHFRYWSLYKVTQKAGETTTTNPTHINATEDGGNLTAYFLPRYVLQGSRHDGETHGMPDFTTASKWDDRTADFVVNSYTNTVSDGKRAVELVCTRTLEPNTRYKFEIFDRTSGKTMGHGSGSDDIGANNWPMDTQDRTVFFNTTGRGTYTFTVTHLSEDANNYPYVQITAPTSYQLTLGCKYADVDAGLHDGTTGGSVSATATEGGSTASIANGNYIVSGGSIEFTPSPSSGYTFGGWYKDASCTNAYTDGSDNAEIDGDNVLTISSIGANVPVYAKFVETATTVNLANDTHGHVEVSGATVTSTKTGITTSKTITAVPQDAAWHFLNWTVPDGVTRVSGALTDETITIKTTTSGKTVTANFELRYELRGSLNNTDPDNEAGMPGWSTGAPFSGTVTSLGTADGVNLTCTRTLYPNTNYKFVIHDRELNRNMGYAPAGTDIGSSSLVLDDENMDVVFWTAGRGDYTFNITCISNDDNRYPTVKLNRPASYILNLGWGYSQDSGSTFTDGSVGGNVTATATENATTVAITNGQYVASGGRIDLSAHAADGYTFLGYYNGDGYNTRFSENANWYNENISAATTAYAKFQANAYAITFDATTNGGTLSGSNQNVIYNNTSIASCPVGVKEGYHFKGWYTASSDGELIIDASGNLQPSITVSETVWTDSSSKWKKLSGATVYAQYEVAQITNIALSPGTVVAPNATITVTPTIDPEPEGTTTVCWRVLYSNGNPLAEQPTFTPVSGNTVSFPASATSGSYKLEAVLHLGSGCGGEELSTYEANFQVAGDHTVTVQYKDASNNVIAPSGSVTGKPLEWTEVVAHEIFGYTYSGMTAGDGVTLRDTTAARLTELQAEDPTIVGVKRMKAVYDGKLTINYTQNQMIYFKNTLGWENVYVNFYGEDGYWNNPKGSGNNGVTHQNKQMTQIGETDVWYYDYGAESISPSLYVSFTDMSQNNYENFSNLSPHVQVVYPANYQDAIHTDKSSENGFKPATPMFVPLANQTATTLNSNADYYNRGYWTKYTEGTGYTLEIYYDRDDSPIVQSIPFTSADDLMPMSAVVDLEAGQTYRYQVRRGGTEDAGIYYGNTGTMTYASHGVGTGWIMENTMGGGFQKAKITANAAGNYTFNLSYSANKENEYRLRMEVDYPIADGDYRLIYTDATRDSGTRYKPSAIVTKANNSKDTVSFFIRPGSTPVLKIQQASVTNTGVITWGDLSDISSSVRSLPKDSVYNICLTMNGSGVISVEKVEAYTGNFYIRTNAAGASKWDNYRSSDHLMTYSEYSATNADYSHYFMAYVGNGTNVKFVVANDYSPCISDTVKVQTYRDGDASHVNGEGDIQADANVRFMWNRHNNGAYRAYLAAAKSDGSEFLVLRANSPEYLMDENGNALLKSATSDQAGYNHGAPNNCMQFTDNENWIYETTVKIKPGAFLKLYANFHNSNFYYKGENNDDFDGSNAIQLLGGSGEAEKIRVIYDFKTDRLVSAWQPSGDISTQRAINADVMFVREHQGDIEQLTFSKGDGVHMGSITKINTAYAVLRFNKWTLNNKSKESGHAVLDPGASRYERDLFYVSFPFKVAMNEVFGFGTYGKHWIIEYYDGAARAANGFWADTPTYWRFVTDRKGKFFEPNQGYIIALDLDELGEDSEVWDKGVENVELYFPSYGTMGDITNATVVQKLPSHECTINRPTAGGDRRIKDSHWNVMSVPTYVNTDDVSFANTTWTTSTRPNFLYEWNMGDNSLTPRSGNGYLYHAMHAYIVQYEGDVTWSSTSVTPTSAPNRNPDAPADVEYRLELQQNDVAVDQAFVRLSNEENVSAGFAFGEDMSKEFNKNRSNIYTFIGKEQVAGNCLPMTEQTTVVPVGVIAKTTGDYTFALPEGTNGVGVTLIDNETGIRTSLSALDYTVSLTAGTYNERFVLEISPIHHMPTGIEMINDANGENGVRKLMIDGILYIVKDGKMFDARGARVK